jgi:hypothetical protein
MTRNKQPSNAGYNLPFQHIHSFATNTSKHPQATTTQPKQTQPKQAVIERQKREQQQDPSNQTNATLSQSSKESNNTHIASLKQRITQYQHNSLNQ